MPPVTSRQNPVVARFRAAARREAGDLLLLDGMHLVAEALDAGITLREAAVSTDASDRAGVTAVLDRLCQLDVPITTVTTAVMSAVSPVRSSSPIVAIGVQPHVSDAPLYDGASLLVIAIDVQDPGNLGAIVRVAEAGGATGVVCAGACADPFGWKALRGSMGSALRMSILVRGSSAEAVDDARRHGCRIVAAVPRDGRPLFDVDLTGPVAVLIGSEGLGLTSSQLGVADERMTVPMQPPVESLNAAVTAALIVYEARRQRGPNN